MITLETLQSCVKDKNELASKLSEMAVFLDSAEFASYTPQQSAVVRMQISIMRSYLDILEMRIFEATKTHEQRTRHGDDQHY